MSEKILFLVPYPLQRAPSQRFRVEAFLPYLKNKNVDYRIDTFLDAATWDVLYNQSSITKKVIGVLKGFLQRWFVVLFIVHRYQYVFIHREASPLGPPIFEWFIAKVWGKKIVYDFDDAIWIPNTTAENRLADWTKAFWKVKYICKWSYKVVGGNDYLCNYARQYNNNVILLPTCVDVVSRYNKIKDQQAKEIVIGWTGSHSTMKYLDVLVPVFEKLIQEFDVQIVVVSNKPPQFSLPNLKFLSWQEKTEIEDLLQMNIGVMPLTDDAWSEGKCGFKIIQYMALGIPAVANAVGVNSKIIDDGINGFICSTETEWYEALTQLIIQPDLREKMGKRGRDKIVEAFSIQRYEGTFSELFS